MFIDLLPEELAGLEKTIQDLNKELRNVTITTIADLNQVKIILIKLELAITLRDLTNQLQVMFGVTPSNNPDSN